MRCQLAILTAMRRAALAVSFAVLGVACGGSAATTEVPATVTVTGVEASTDSGGAARAVDEPVESAEPSADLDMEAVVAAALVIASGGDLEGAISSGLVGEAEAEAALDALERGSLDRILGD